MLCIRMVSVSMESQSRRNVNPRASRDADTRTCCTNSVAGPSCKHVTELRASEPDKQYSKWSSAASNSPSLVWFAIPGTTTASTTVAPTIDQSQQQTEMSAWRVHRFWSNSSVTNEAELARSISAMARAYRPVLGLRSTYRSGQSRAKSRHALCTSVRQTLDHSL